MRIETLPPVAGWYWLRDGFELIGKRPGLLPSLLIIMFIFMMLVNSIRLAGPLIVSLLLPCFMVLLMDACRKIREEGEYFIDFNKALNRRLIALLLLGFVEFLISQFSLWITVLLDNGTLVDYLKNDYASDNASAQTHKEALDHLLHVMSLPSARLWIVLVAVQKLLFWYVPLLVAWQNFSIGKALFYNYYALRRNWKAFLVYGVIIFLFSQAIAMIVIVMLTSNMLILVLALLFFAIIPVLVNSLYVSYSQIFLAEMPARGAASFSNDRDND